MPPEPDIRALFARHGLRWTKQREELYCALAACASHPTAEELFHLVGAADQAGSSLATVYNTLEALTEAGLCRRLSTPSADGAARYDADMRDHAHMVFPDGRVRDLPADLSAELLAHIPPDLRRRIEDRMGIPIGRTSVEFTGRVR